MDIMLRYGYVGYARIAFIGFHLLFSPKSINFLPAARRLGLGLLGLIVLVTIGSRLTLFFLHFEGFLARSKKCLLG